MLTNAKWLNPIAQLATVLLGLLTGAMLLLALGLVPYWQSLHPEDFREVFDESLPEVGGTLVVLTIAATGTIVVAAGMAWRAEVPARGWLVAAAIGALTMLATVPLYFAGANAELSDGSLTPAGTADELSTWRLMHWLRTLIGIGALWCAVRVGYQANETTAASAAGGREQ